MRRHARLVDYHLHEGCNARALLCLTVDMVELYLDLKDVYFITDYGLNLPLTGITSSKNELNKNVPRERYEIFERVEYGKKKLYSAHNEIPFYTWGKQQCCLPRGATRAALKDGPPLQSKVQPADPEMLDQKETQDIPGRDEGIPSSSVG